MVARYISRLFRRGDPPKTYVINRVCDADRLKKFRDSAAPYTLDLTVVEAVDAHGPDFRLEDYRHEMRNGWYRGRMFKPGAVGCFLSHIKCWHLIAAGSATGAYVFEDDAVFLSDPAGRIGEMQQADFTFTSFRTSTWTRGRGTASVSDCYTRFLADGRPAEEQGVHLPPGSDGYYLTRLGAEALLQRVDDLGMCGDVDFFLVAACLTGTEFPDPMPQAYAESRTIRMTQDAFRPNPLNGLILGDPLNKDEGDSVLRHRVKVRMAP